MNAVRAAAHAPDRCVPAGETPFDAAARQNFPAFLTPVALSTPANATPFVVARARFGAMARRWPGRSHLVDALDEAIAAATGCGVEILAMLVGGSFTDLRNRTPRDIDAVAFYRRAESADAVHAQGLAALQARAKEAGADLRFIPVDGNPIVLIRSISYFTRLYSESRPGSAQDHRRPRGLILVDCAEAAVSPASMKDGVPLSPASETQP